MKVLLYASIGILAVVAASVEGSWPNWADAILAATGGWNLCAAFTVLASKRA